MEDDVRCAAAWRQLREDLRAGDVMACDLPLLSNASTRDALGGGVSRDVRHVLWALERAMRAHGGDE